MFLTATTTTITLGAAATLLVSFLAAAGKLLGSFTKLISKSNIQDVADAIKDENSGIRVELKELTTTARQLMEENAELKKDIKDLYEQITRIKSGD